MPRVQLLKQYLRKRPQELRDKGPFYLIIIENRPQNKCLVQEAAARRKQHRQYDEERCQGHASREKQEEND